MRPILHHDRRHAAARFQAARPAPVPRLARAPRIQLLAASIALLTLAASFGGASYALWSDTATFAGFTVRAGDLDLVRDGEVRWAQVTPGVSDPASGTLGVTPANFRTMPGDVIRLTYPFRVIARGDNLQAGVTISAAEGAGSAATSSMNAAMAAATPASGTDLQISFHVETPAGTQVAPLNADGGPGADAALGDTVTLPELPQGGEQALVLAVTVRVCGDYRWSDAPEPDFLATWSAGTFAVQLAQHHSDEQLAGAVRRIGISGGESRGEGLGAIRGEDAPAPFGGAA